VPHGAREKSVAAVPRLRQFDFLLLLDQISQCGAGEGVLKAVLRPFEQAAQGAAADVFAVGPGHFATLKNNAAFDSLYDFQDRDLVGILGQGKAAPSAADGTDQSCFDQALEDLGQEAFRDSLIAADLVDHGPLARTLPGQMHQPHDPVFACASDLHDTKKGLNSSSRSSDTL
jgi:hypothetical protein